MDNNFPAISVIIPLYNAEKYVAECLESILAQTFKNFEVIIVDDCSTDNSVRIVKNYIPKFGGRLKLAHMEKNSGSGAIPRNKGLELSRGKYVFNMDNDDLLIGTALEEMYSFAENFDADVVYCEKYFATNTELSEVYIRSEQQGILVDRPEFVTENLAERVKEILDNRFWVTPWSKLVKRKPLIENEIFFPPCIISDDDIWTYELIFCMKKFLRVPAIVYVNRRTENSMTRIEKTPAQEINFWLNPLVVGMNYLDNFMGKIKFFQQNPNYRIVILDHLANGRCFAQLSRYCSQLSPAEFYQAVKQSFEKNFGEQSILFAYLCTLIHEQRKKLKLKDEQIGN